MRKLLHEITRQSEIGSFGKRTAAALIYADKITVREPYEQWADGYGILSFRVTCISNQTIINDVIADIVGNRPSDAWHKIRDFIK